MGLREMGVLAYVVDAEGRVVETSDAEAAPGRTLAPASALGGAVLEAAADAVARARTERRTATDSVSGVHWLVVASPAEGGRAEVVAVDVTEAVVADRRRLQEKVVHSVQNVNFAMRAVLEAMTVDRPSLVDEEYVRHLREPLERLSALMTALRASHDTEPPSLRSTDVRVDDVVERALALLERHCVPSNVAVASRPMIVRGDVDALAEAVAAMVESGGGSNTSLVVGTRDLGGHRFACVDVERGARPDDARSVAAAWDAAGGRTFAVQLRLVRARATILASGGAVSAEKVAPGRLRLGARLPLVSGG